MLGVLLVLSIGATQGETAPLLKGSFRGQAYATFANAEAGPVATQLGRSAFQPVPCQGTGGRTLSNTVDTVKAGNQGKTLTANGTLSTVFTEKTSTSARVKNTSTVTGLNAFDGAITADVIKAVANTSANATTINSTPAGSEFVNLKIAGRSINADVAPNTRVNLPGVGYVLLKSVKTSGDGQKLSKITVEMLTVVVTNETNAFDLPVGSRIVVAHAVSGFSRTEPAVIVGGQAYAATALTTTNAIEEQDIKNRVGKAAFVVMGCEGTNGKTKTNNVNTLDVEGVLSSGTGVTPAFGGPTASGTVAKTTAEVQDVNLLGGLIVADVVKAVAKDTFTNGNRISSTQGTRFVGLEVAGVAVPVDVEPNTRIELAGIGFVIVNEQILPAAGSTERTQVNGLRVKVNKNNTLGIPVGTQIIVAHADSTAVRFQQTP